jgi:hypothetical protein
MIGWKITQICAALAVMVVLWRSPIAHWLVLLLAYVAARFVTEIATCAIELVEGFRRRVFPATSGTKSPN